ncbi:hypothetical protein M9Y10_003293 [Tritrichomonas musculus]|uniref:ADP-ribosylhydrolase ARH3 n=1 Tax=Tritrichomonas musculus TaxID=1915356 RepID=A0ABR2JQC6_9EUKA
MKFANLAYLKEIPPINEFHDVHVLDLLCTSIKILTIDNFPNLTRLRAPRSNLERATITNCPNLQIIDFSQSSLVNIHLENLPKLRTLDLRSTKVSFLNFSLPSLEYLDISRTKIQNELPDSPNLLALDNSGCIFKDYDLLPIAMKYPHLQRLRCLDYYDVSFEVEYRIQVDLNKLSEHPCLEHLFVGPSTVTCDSISPKTNLTTVCLQYVEFKEGTKQQLLSSFHCVLINHVALSSNHGYRVSTYPEYKRMDWEESALLLYGPWGIPQTDLTPKISAPQPFDISTAYLLMRDVQPSTVTISEVSEKFDLKIALNHMMGAVFGSALGDCLGMSAEMTDTKYARFSLDVPLSILWNYLPSWYRADVFYRATVTDDTEQAILLMRTLADCNGELNLAHFAKLLTDWANKGVSEHCQEYALDVGETTWNAITSHNYLKDPLTGSFDTTYESRGNGCAMRTAPIGCFKFWDLNTVTKYAFNFGCTTHYNDVCAVCTILCSLLIAKNIQRYSLKENLAAKDQSSLRMTDNEIDELIDYSFKVVADEMSDDFDVEASRAEVMKYLKADSFDKLHLSGKQIGYVLRATGAAVLALRKGMSYEEAMTEVVRWAGDSDSNAAVVGGVIGAVVGFSGIPSDMMKYLYTGNWEYVEFARMCEVMDIQPPPSPFLELSYQ